MKENTTEIATGATTAVIGNRTQINIAVAEEIMDLMGMIDDRVEATIKTGKKAFKLFSQDLIRFLPIFSCCRSRYDNQHQYDNKR